MIVYAFDVDETLEISSGPVTLQSMMDLRIAGHVVGICGNMHVFCSVPGWQHLCSFLGQSFLPKEVFLHGLKINMQADDYIMVGNIMGVSGASDDKGAAEKAGWRFIKESDFANGER